MQNNDSESCKRTCFHSISLQTTTKIQLSLATFKATEWVKAHLAMHMHLGLNGLSLMRFLQHAVPPPQSPWGEC